MISLRPYRKAGVPLLAIQTADPMEIIRLAVEEANKNLSCPAMRWDCIHGLSELTESAQTFINDMTANGTMDPAIATGNPIDMIRAIEKLTEREDQAAANSIIVTLGLGDLMLDASAGPAIRQAVWNLRDILSRQNILFIITVPMGWRNPLPNDIAVEIAPLPTRDDHQKLATKLCEAAKLKEPAKSDKARIGDALLGLSGFAAEQAVALSLSKAGVDIDSLWARKRQQISETGGLNCYAGKETFKDLGGLEEVKGLFKGLMEGKRRPGGIVFIDEGEKALAGYKTDTSGVAQDQVGCVLKYMEDNEASGALLVGPPGAAKSAFAKALGNEAGVPTIMMDFGGMKGSLLGESETRIRNALSVITAVCGGKPFFVMTCNAIGILPPELKRRFKFGIIYFDLPTKTEQKTIWPIWMRKFNIPDQKLPDCDGWTGAEIKQCCDLADSLGMTLVQAARFIIPVSVSARDKIVELRKEANGKYLSASYPGPYKMMDSNKGPGTRNINLE